MLLIEMLKFRSSEKSKGALEEPFGNDHLKDLMLNGQICQKSHLNPPPLLDHSITEPLHQKLVDKKLVNLTRYKTELCRQFEEKGHCQYGEKCQFAHGVVEKRFVERHPKYKTEMCRTFHQQGFCSYGLRCNFIHNEDERRFGSVSDLSSTSSAMQDRVASPPSVLKGKMLVGNGHSGDLSGYSVVREPTRSMSVVESSFEKDAFSNDVNIVLHLKGLAGLSTEGIPSFHRCVGSGVSAIAKDQKSRGRPILSRSVSSAVPSLFSDDNAV